MDISTILEKCDHTLLRVDCTSAEIRALCDQAIKYGCRRAHEDMHGYWLSERVYDHGRKGL